MIGFYVAAHPARSSLSRPPLYPTDPDKVVAWGAGSCAIFSDQAREVGLPIRLMALRESPANDFYLSCGFVLESADELDNHYVWQAG